MGFNRGALSRLERQMATIRTPRALPIEELRDEDLWAIVNKGRTSARLPPLSPNCSDKALAEEASRDRCQ